MDEDIPEVGGISTKDNVWMRVVVKGALGFKIEFGTSWLMCSLRSLFGPFELVPPRALYHLGNS